MSNTPRRPILFRGELYSRVLDRTPNWGPKETNVTFEQARENLLENLSALREVIEKPSKLILPNEQVVCIRVGPEFNAKAYYLNSIFDNSKFGLTEIGTRRWRIEDKKPVKGIPPKEGKLYFVRTSSHGLDTFEAKLNKSVASHSKAFIEHIRRILVMDFLKPEEQTLDFENDWSHGVLEAVIHPFNTDSTTAIQRFSELVKTSGANQDNYKLKQYDGGITFISLEGTKETLRAISGYNALRSIHPLRMAQQGITGKIKNHPGPQTPNFKKKSSIVVGVIDGGIDMSNPYVRNYTEEVHAITLPSDQDCINHGTFVTNALLYGPVNRYSENDALPEPNLRVKNFRVMHTKSDPTKLYDAIDAMENFIPINKEISVYNLSMGPTGPIADDSISRFTFACDRLSSKHNILFCVAVGNDGTQPRNRIQSPSDSVNSLAVGAYTRVDNGFGKAPYSCIGPGREGAKLKPDLLAYGGCTKYPMHLVGSSDGIKTEKNGTSYATPFVSAASALLIGGSNKEITPLVGRALLVHAVANNKQLGHSFTEGHGFLPEDTSDIVTCVDKSYTLIYKGEIDQNKYVEIPIPWVNEISQGSVIIQYTLAILTPVDPQSPDDYTSCSAEAFFYPHEDKFSFRKGRHSKIVDIKNQRDLVKELLDDGWKKSKYPTTASGNTHRSETDLNMSVRWDSTDSRFISKLAGSLKNPKFHLHAMGRATRASSERVKFCLVVSVSAPKAKIDLYSRILNDFNALMQLRVGVELPVYVTQKT